MATESGPANPPLGAEGRECTEIERLLREEPFDFEFFQAVRLIGLLSPEREPVGEFSAPRREILRFGASPDYTFPASQISQIDWPEGAQPLMRVNFMGLTGPMGLLPLYYSTLVRERLRAHDTALRDFFDIFNHRAISMFYRAWEKYRYPMQYRAGGEDRHSRRVLSLLGLGTAGAGGAAGIPAASVLRIAGLLRSRARSAAGLEAALRDHTGGLPIRVVPFVSRRAPVPPDQRARLGRGTCRLGETACLGERVLDSAGAFEIAIGPLSCEDYRRFLPGGDALDRLVRLVRFYVPDPLHFHVRLRTRDGEAPRLALAPSAGLPLGRMSWLAPRPLEAGEAVVPVRDSDPLHRARAVAAPADSGLGQRRDSWSTSTSVS